MHNFVLLKINGKTDASNGPGELATRLLLGHLPFMVADAARVAPLYQLLEAYYEVPVARRTRILDSFHRADTKPRPLLKSLRMRWRSLSKHRTKVMNLNSPNASA